MRKPMLWVVVVLALAGLACGQLLPEDIEVFGTPVSSGQPLTMNTSAGGTFDAVFETDRWTFAAEVGQTVTVLVYPDGITIDVELIGPDGTVINDEGITEDVHNFTFVVEANGTYTVAVEGYEAGFYNIQLHNGLGPEGPADLRPEMGVNPELSITSTDEVVTLLQPLRAGEVSAGILTDDGAHQWLYQGTAGELVEIQVDWLYDLDGDLALYDPNGEDLINSAVYLTEIYDGLPLQVLLAETGTYTLEVGERGSGGGVYVVTLNVVSALSPEPVQGIDPDFPLFEGRTSVSRITLVQPIAVGVPQTAVATDSGEYHNWVVEGQANQTIQVRATYAVGAEGALDVDLIGPDGEVIATDVAVLVLPADGLYTLQVRPDDESGYVIVVE